MEDRDALHTIAGRYEIVTVKASDPANDRAELIFRADDGTEAPTGHYSERKRPNGDLFKKRVQADLKEWLDRYTDFYVRLKLRLEVIGKRPANQGNAAYQDRGIPASTIPG
ncbi:hypothetical protein BB934_45410 (plasmid) [Microvirga ossetica]|uniref:Uncharacterized protein n=1 Tax=Microvirga ossetica TaxID=1882682 RepID=A0A1B2EZP1_9HYPH|nr:hypothetical protein [Microvirga ossetica]ANY85460.1 hypothetical protein BB934_45410 [Microvirga ossetica]